MSVIGDPLIGNFGNKAVRDGVNKLTPFHGTGFSASRWVEYGLHHPPRRRKIQRKFQGKLGGRPLGVRLWLADMAAGLRLCGEGSGAADRGTSRALRLFLRPSWHARTAGSRARP